MPLLVVYSSRTGNTRQVAEAALEALPGQAVVVPVEDAPDPDGFAAVAVGFWVDRGRPDAKAAAFMETLKGRDVAAFGTLGARPDSEHAGDVRRATEEMLHGNRFLGSYLCQGRIDPRIIEAMERSGHHPMTPERKANIEEAERHPDQTDLENAQAFFRTVFQRIGEGQACEA
ncbi:MAG: flavodoxin family protein [Desulfovibrio sp.]